MRVGKVCGFQQLDATALAASTALQIPTHPQTGEKPNAAMMTAFTGNIRYRNDGTAPTASIGLRLVAGVAPYLYMGDLTNFRAIAEGGSPTLDVTYVVAVPD